MRLPPPWIALTGLLTLCVVDSAPAQGGGPPPILIEHRTVDGLTGTYDGANNTPFNSITAAISAPPSGNANRLVVQVYGMTYDSLPFGYCAATHPLNPNPGIQGEAFPIVLGPAGVQQWSQGVQVMAVGSSPVLLWADSVLKEAAFFQLDPSQGGVDVIFEIQDLKMIGAHNAAILANALNQGDHAQLTVDDVDFGNCTSGAIVTAQDGGQISPADFVDCSIATGTVPVSQNSPSQPNVETWDIGLGFYATEQSGAGNSQDAVVNPKVVRLTTQGSFPGTALMSTSRLLDFMAMDSQFRDGRARITGNVTSSLLHCQQALGSSGDGWRTAVHVSANAGAAYSGQEHAARVNLTITDTSATLAKGDGVFSESGGGGAVQIEIESGSEIGPNEANGIHALDIGGYTAIALNNSKVKSNDLDGIRCHSTYPAGAVEYDDPLGLYLEVQDSEVAYNKGNGIHVSAVDSIVGGTRVLASGQFYYHGYSRPGFTYLGQGLINRSSIHTNGWYSGTGAGILFDLAGGGGITNFGYGSLRILNTFVFGNRGGGFLANVGSNASNDIRLAVPFVHCTVAGNSQGSTFYEYRLVPGSQYLLSNISFSIPNVSYDLWSALYHSIFYPGSQTWPFTDSPTAALLKEDSPGQLPNELPFSGIRAFWTAMPSLSSWILTSEIPPFFNYSQQSTDPADFYLIKQHVNWGPFFSTVTDTLGELSKYLPFIEYQHDFEYQPEFGMSAADPRLQYQGGHSQAPIGNSKGAEEDN